MDSCTCVFAMITLHILTALLIIIKQVFEQQEAQLGITQLLFHQALAITKSVAASCSVTFHFF